MKHFATFLRRELQGRKHCEVAAGMGVSPSTLSKALSGDYHPERETLRRMIRGFSKNRRDRANFLAAWLKDQSANYGGGAARLIEIYVGASGPTGPQG